jgi:hypothetical protein
VTRYEIKLALHDRDRSRLLSELRLLPNVLTTLHPPRTVQSVYLDTHGREALQDNLAGLAARRKVRFRWYGDDRQLVLGALEIKRRNHQFGDKDVHAIPDPLPVAGAARAEFVAALRRHTPAALQPLLDGQEPSQWIRYRREYFGDTTGRLRVTVDSDLVAFEQRYAARLGDAQPTPLPRLCIVELKADAADRLLVEAWLQQLDVRPSRCSKYVMACLPSEAPEPSRFET